MRGNLRWIGPARGSVRNARTHLRTVSKPNCAAFSLFGRIRAGTRREQCTHNDRVALKRSDVPSL